MVAVVSAKYIVGYCGSLVPVVTVVAGCWFVVFSQLFPRWLRWSLAPTEAVKFPDQWSSAGSSSVGLIISRSERESEREKLSTIASPRLLLVLSSTLWLLFVNTTTELHLAFWVF
jgi:hypothetical protein